MTHNIDQKIKDQILWSIQQLKENEKTLRKIHRCNTAMNVILEIISVRVDTMNTYDLLGIDNTENKRMIEVYNNALRRYGKLIQIYKLNLL